MSLETETQTEIKPSSPEIAEALNEISTDLFGQGEEGRVEGSKTPEAGSDAASVEASAPRTGEEEKTPVEGEKALEAQENSEAVVETGAPKTWTKEALETWATIPERARAEILKREEDFLRGITQYKSAAEIGDRYSQVVQPYAPILEAEKIDPVQMFQSFAANHYLLSRGTPAQKVELAANLINGYGVDFNALVEHLGNNPPEVIDPRVAALEREIAELKAGAITRTDIERQSAMERVNAEVEAFAKDPAHPHFDILVDDIGELMEKGQAKSLQEAYEKAVWLNPTTRAKELERQRAEALEAAQTDAKGRQDKIATRTAADLNVLPQSRNGTVPVGSLDDTLEETLAAIKNRG